MLKIELLGEIRDHKLVIFNRNRLLEDLQLSANCRVKLTIKKWGTKSNAQLGYLWGVVYPECRLGYLNLGTRLTDEQVHEFFVGEFLSDYLHDEHGAVIMKIRGSTSDLNKEEMMVYIDRIIEFAQDHLGVYIPPANKDYRLSF